MFIFVDKWNTDGHKFCYWEPDTSGRLGTRSCVQNTGQCKEKNNGVSFCYSVEFLN